VRPIVCGTDVLRPGDVTRGNRRGW
jgi:hypothetical protein